MIYIPKHFQASDLGAMQALMRRFPFATLISTRTDDVRVSHLPLIWEPSTGRFGRLRGHLARANPHWHWLAQGRHLVVFHGPHAYISPTWYGHHPSVPTWNYAVVHASGPCTLMDDAQELRNLVEALSTRFEEENGTDWKMPEDAPYVDKMMAQIVGFTLEIDDLQGKFKLSQNRPADDRARLPDALKSRGWSGDDELAQWMDSLVGKDRTRSL